MTARARVDPAELLHEYLERAVPPVPMRCAR